MAQKDSSSAAKYGTWRRPAAAAQLSIGPDGPVSLPRDSSETLALLLSRGLLAAERDDHAMGRPLVYRPTPRLLQLLGAETIEEARGRLRVPAEHRSDCESSIGGEPPAECQPGAA